MTGLLAPVVAASHASRAEAAPPVGTGGLFTPTQGRAVDTRNGTGGYNTPLQANVTRAYPIDGVAGVPSSGVSAVAVTVTVLNPTAIGEMFLNADPVVSGSAGVSITWGAGETVSNTALVPVGSDGDITASSSQSVNMLVDVQGYFLEGNGTPAPGGYVPIAGARLADTTTGKGVPMAQVPTGSSLTVTAGGTAGIPANASAVFVTVSVVNQAASGYLTVYPTGAPRPATSENFPANTVFATGTTADLNSSGQFSIYVGGGGPTDLAVDVVGYFAATNGSGAFTPWQQRVFDTRLPSPGAALAAASVTTFQVAGTDGVPAVGTGLSAVAVDIVAIPTSGSAAGYLRAWAADQSEPTAVSTMDVDPAIITTGLAITAVAADGTIKIRNATNGTLNLTLDVEGYFLQSGALPEASGAACYQSGIKSGAQPLTHGLTDRSSMSLDPVNGNMTLSGTLLHLRGVGQDVSVGWRYNGINDTRPTLSDGLYETALQPWHDGSFTYVAPDGGCYKFTPDPSKAGAWVVPAGINATLTQPSATTVSLRFNPSGITNTYTDVTGVWQLTSSADASSTTAPNIVAYFYGSNHLTSLKDTQGRQVTFAYNDPNNSTQPSAITDTSLSRTIALAYSGPSGALSQITDAAGAITKFGYATSGPSQGLISTTDPLGNVTAFTYDATYRLTKWILGQGSSTEGDWYAAYPSTAQTVITDADSHKATYALAAGTTTEILDAMGDKVASTWNAHDDLMNRTDGEGNMSTGAYGGTNNANDLLSMVTSPAGTTGGTGASVSLTYPTNSTGKLGDYRAMNSMDGQGNTTTYMYDQNTEQVMSSSTKTAGTNGAAVGGTRLTSYQGDMNGTNCGAKNGEVCTQTNGNNNVTSYAYDGQGNPNVITPPAPLGKRMFTYDAAGRVLTGTDGRGDTAYYGYDSDDRTASVSYTSATSCPTASCVSYAYDGDGNLTSRTSPTGVTAFGYDTQNRPTTKKQGGTLISTAAWDPAGNLLTDNEAGAGTTTYGYDSANRLTSLAEPGGSCTAQTPTLCTTFGYDHANRRTGVTYPNGQKITVVYDHASRVQSVTATNSGGTTLVSRMYVYTSAQGGGDQTLVHTIADQTGTTLYSYDGLNQLTSAVLTPLGGGAAVTSGWTYDNDGNRLTAAKTGSPATYYAYNAADQLCWSGPTSGTSCGTIPTGSTTYSFDGTGNQRTDTTTAAISNAFTVFNQISTSTTGGVATAFTYSDSSNTERLTSTGINFQNGTLGVAQTTASGTTVSYVRDPGGNLIAMHTGGKSYYYTTDQQGSVIALTDSTQTLVASYAYDPWGNATMAAGPMATLNPYRYATSYLDPSTGYLKLGARYYNPVTGRFTQPDPAKLAAGYTYAGDIPSTSSDPTGRFSISFSGCVAVVIGVCGTLSIGTDSNGDPAASASVDPSVGIGSTGDGTFSTGDVTTGGYSDSAGGGCFGGDDGPSACGSAVFSNGGQDATPGLGFGEGSGLFFGEQFGYGI